MFFSKNCGFLFLCFLFSCCCYAQNNNFNKEINFSLYLSGKQLNKEALYVLEKIDTTPLSDQQKDSLHHYKGNTLFDLKRLSESANTYLKLSAASPWYTRSRFYAGYNYSYLKNVDSANLIFANINIPSSDSTLEELKAFELASAALLQRDYKKYNALKTKFSYTSYAIKAPELKMDEYYQKLIAHKHKSPIIAGILSAIIPGAGKYYAGKRKQAFGTFLPIATLGVLTAESYARGGVKSVGFIGLASIFSLFYVSNVWGSIVSVKIVNDDHNRYYNNEILFNMQLPIRNLFR